MEEVKDGSEKHLRESFEIPETGSGRRERPHLGQTERLKGVNREREEESSSGSFCVLGPTLS